MDTLFFNVLNMSISASWLIIVVILIRLFLGKAPKGLRYVLWALVGIRLLCPFSMESALSLVPSAETFSKENMYSDKPEIHSGVPAVDKVVNPILSGQVSDETEGVQNTIGDSNTIGNSNIASDSNMLENEKNLIQDTMHAVALIWVFGMVVMLIYSVVSYVRLRNSLKASMQVEENLWVCDEIQSPFIFGMVHPRIYVPSFIEEKQMPYIIAHENEHLKYHDHWWKPLGFAILSLHWFNPLVWIAYILLCRDIELACDERVIHSMNDDEKKNYSKSLLLCSNVRHVISACPVAFGEIGVKERIKSIVNYKKPAVWVAGIGIVVCLIVAICFLTNPKQETGNGVDDTEGTENIESTQQDDEMTGGAENSDSNTTHIVEGSDTTYVVEDSSTTRISVNLLNWFETEFFNNNENPITNMFLTSEYRKPEDIDLSHLFYGGANGVGNTPISQAEIHLLKQRYHALTELDEAKTTVQEMDDILQKYMGLTLRETNQVNLNTLYYLEEYQAYYNVAGDTMMSKYDIIAGWINEDGTVTLQYHDALSSNNTNCLVTLQEKDGSYYFVSNIVVNEIIGVSTGVRDEELTLMQKVLLNKASYNNGRFIGDDYLKYTQFFIVDLDRDGVDEVCVEYAVGLILIFHEKDGAIYGYDIEYRPFHPVYKDGTFSGSSSAVNTEFCGNFIFYETLGNGFGYSYEYITSKTYDEDGTEHYYKDSSYSSDAKEITKEEYDQIMSNYAMEEVERYEFTVENILKYVN